GQRRRGSNDRGRATGSYWSVGSRGRSIAVGGRGDQFVRSALLSGRGLSRGGAAQRCRNECGAARYWLSDAASRQLITRHPEQSEGASDLSEAPDSSLRSERRSTCVLAPREWRREVCRSSPASSRG